MLCGAALLAALATTQVPIRLRNGSNDAGASISPEDAIRLVLRNPLSFEGKARTGRVYWIRATTGKSSMKDTAHWDDRAVIRFHTDQTSTPLKRRNQRVAAVWDRVVADPPRYMRPV